jgi:hypothetical protein
MSICSEALDVENILDLEWFLDENHVWYDFVVKREAHAADVSFKIGTSLNKIPISRIAMASVHDEDT